MSTYVLMRILESAPHRYDLGMRILTFGRLARTYDDLVARVEAGDRVLDVGCGTGALSARAAQRGAVVKGIDTNPEMLAIANTRLAEAGIRDLVHLDETGVATLDREPAAEYDIVMSGLCFSELSGDEIAYSLVQFRRILRPGGLLLIADEVEPRGLLRRILHRILRLPLQILAYVVTQQTSRAIANLPERIAAAGFTIESVRAPGLGDFMTLIARNPKEPST